MSAIRLTAENGFSGDQRAIDARRRLPELARWRLCMTTALAEIGLERPHWCGPGPLHVTLEEAEQWHRAAFKAASLADIVAPTVRAGLKVSSNDSLRETTFKPVSRRRHV